MADITHNKKHDIDSTNDHTGVSGATTDNLMSFNASDLPKDSGIAASTVSTVTSQPGAPSSKPGSLGLINIDTTNKVVYISKGTSSSADWSIANIKFLEFSLVEATTDVATGTNLYGDHVMKYDGLFLQSDTFKQWLMANNSTAGVTGTMVVDVHLNGTTIMTTNKLDIETGEKTTEDATTQPDLTTTSFSRGDILTIDVDAIHTTAAKGLAVTVATIPTA